MSILSSKTLIKAHALFLFILAVYLTKSPEAITDSDVVFMLGEALQIDVSPTFSRPQSPFAICGILLVADALVDLIIVTKVPHMNEILATADAARHRPSNYGIRDADAPRMNPFMVRLAGLYSDIWMLISASRFCLFFAVSFFIYQSKPGAWGVNPTASFGGEVISGLDQLKNRVVFTYGFMEMMFWLWVSPV
ncbi:hypothetical protein PHISCL_01080 [Aspergillus sclerotialis]|uniref:Uncharacterized protein n=1 Tax=Aspergillus sclerotialis TaxID=2070753 RepID=A0A3A2ZTS1_9EURO|nr:hypothetical protein PHISCL_01080 [Aspergillus sclerotialis]